MLDIKTRDAVVNAIARAMSYYGIDGDTYISDAYISEGGRLVMPVTMDGRCYEFRFLLESADEDHAR